MQERTGFRSILAGGVYFVVIFAAGFMLGAVRELFLMPLLGKSLAVVFELPIILGLAWLVCRWLIERLDVPETTVCRLLMGGTAFVLLMIAEFGVSALVFGRNPLQHILAYSEPVELLGLAGQLLFAAFPLLQHESSDTDNS